MSAARTAGPMFFVMADQPMLMQYQMENSDIRASCLHRKQMRTPSTKRSQSEQIGWQHVPQELPAGTSGW